MVSGIVYFDEIIENIKDATGIENLRPLYSRIRRFCYNCEIDIGAGGVVVLKKKEYTVGDGFYDGTTLKLPNDFVSEWSYGSMMNGIVQGNVFKLFHPGPTTADFKYLGFLLDEEGNPFTTRNRLDAIVAYSIFRLYSSKYFIGTGNQNQYLLYKQEYEDSVLAARGYDAFPSEEEWNELGAIRLGGTFEAMTDCGMKTFCLGSEDPSTTDTTTPEPDPTCVELMEGSANGSATVTGDITFRALIGVESAINGIATVSGTLQNRTFPEFALQASANGQATVTGALLPYVPIVDCNDTFFYQGGIGTFEFQLNLGAGIGISGIRANPQAIPDRFRIEWNGVEVANSKFIGKKFYSAKDQEQELLNLGYLPSEINLTDLAPGYVNVTFNKTAASPSFVRVFVDAPLTGTAWAIDGICPRSSSVNIATVSGTLTAT
jgi:hypothetical protein